MVIAALGLQTGPRLSEQRLEGARRICLYGPGARRPARRIGSGEPCPLYYREPRVELRFVPATAVRIGEASGSGRTVCIYRLAEQDYRTVLPAVIRCPLTPNAGMRVEAGAPEPGR